MTAGEAVDIRCPVEGGTRRLLFRVRHDPDVTVAQPGNVIEVKCRDCSRHQGREVIHQWSAMGEYLGDLDGPRADGRGTGGAG